MPDRVPDRGPDREPERNMYLRVPRVLARPRISISGFGVGLVCILRLSSFGPKLGCSETRPNPHQTHTEPRRNPDRAQTEPTPNPHQTQTKPTPNPHYGRQHVHTNAQQTHTTADSMRTPKPTLNPDQTQKCWAGRAAHEEIRVEMERNPFGQRPKRGIVNCSPSLLHTAPRFPPPRFPGLQAAPLGRPLGLLRTTAMTRGVK